MNMSVLCIQYLKIVLLKLKKILSRVSPVESEIKYISNVLFMYKLLIEYVLF